VQILILLATLVVSWSGTLMLRRYALAHRLMDTPNARSSHQVPTPRGGGVAIVISFLLALVAWSLWSGEELQLVWALVPSSLLIAVIGFWDDHVSLSARSRIVCHLAAAIWAVWWLGGWPVIDVGAGYILHWRWAGSVIAVLGLIWCVNLYNFMDGIDGLAGMQAVFVGLAGGLLLLSSGSGYMPMWLMAAAAAGFLILNWPPARIFMGDAGSGFLGFIIGVMALHSTVSGRTTIWLWGVLMGIFVVDATLTLLRRAVRGIRLSEAHRTHAYQWASRRMGAHKPVTLWALCINVCLLLPAALLITCSPVWSIPACLVCLCLLGILAWKLGAGMPEQAAATERPDSFRDGAA